MMVQKCYVLCEYLTGSHVALSEAMEYVTLDSGLYVISKDSLNHNREKWTRVIKSALGENSKRTRLGMLVNSLALYILSYCIYVHICQIYQYYLRKAHQDKRTWNNCMAVAKWKRSMTCVMCMYVTA